MLFASSSIFANSVRVMFGKESARLFLPAIGSALLFQLPSSCFQNPQLASGFADFAVNVLD